MSKYAKSKIPNPKFQIPNLRFEILDLGFAVQVPMMNKIASTASIHHASDKCIVTPTLNELSKSRRMISSGTKYGPVSTLPAALALIWGKRKTMDADGIAGSKTHARARHDARYQINPAMRIA